MNAMSPCVKVHLLMLLILDVRAGTPHAWEDGHAILSKSNPRCLAFKYFLQYEIITGPVTV